MKINRNALCPCGSNLKYKKCCLHKDINNVSHPSTKTSNEHSFFSRYNSFDLLNSIAALTILPENHGKNVRLEEITHLVLQHYNDNPTLAPLNVLKDYINENYQYDDREEIPVNLFTDSVTFYNGDNIIFPGITESGGFILSNLLTAIFVWPQSSTSSQVRENTNQVSRLLLGLSNTIAAANGYERYMQAVNTGNNIHFPDTATFKKLKSSLVLTNEEMSVFLKQNNIDARALTSFLLDIQANDFNTYLEESPLLHKPILYYEQKYLIVSPATISFALTHYIWNLSAHLGGISQVIKPYHDLVWNQAQLYLSMMQFHGIEESEANLQLTLPDRTGLYRFDKDKIAFIQYVFDNGDQYGTQPFFCSSLTVVSDKEKEQIIKQLQGTAEFMNYQIFDLALISTIGRNFAYGLREVSNTVPLAIPFYEFNILGLLKDCDAIDLWKFAVASKCNRSDFNLLNFSFLDQFSMYRDREESFYSDTLGTDLPAHFGYSQSLYKESLLKSDIHSVIQNKNDRKVLVKVQKADQYGPIYLDPGALANAHLEFYVEGYPQGIWVTPGKQIQGIGPGLRKMYWETNCALAYWLWQICGSVSPHLTAFDIKEPITFNYVFQEEDKFEDIRRDYKRVPDLAEKFKTEASISEITIIIPAEFLAYLYGPDNEGERVLVKTILDGFNKLLSLKGQPIIAPEEITEIIENDAPLGMKKKLLILDTSDNLLLDPTNLEHHRHIQKYDVSRALDQIIVSLGALCPPVGELTTKSDKDNLTHNIVQKALFPLLIKKLSLYNSQELLEHLLGLNESLIRKREELRIHTPSRIACYVSIEQQQQDLLQNLSKNNRTSIATRCLIEHIAAEPYKGTAILSTTAVDELLGIMDQIIDWGSLGDQIHYDLFDVRMGVLATGRIGIDKSTIRDVYDPYNRSKITENVHDAVETYNQVFPQLSPDSGVGIPQKLDEAFAKDFGVTLTRICDFINGLCIIAFDQNTAYGCLKISALREAVNRHVDIFDKNEFEKALEYLSLTKRGKVTKLPEGYDFIDIMPWRFNRMLSLLRKPVVIVDTAGGQVAYWGPRAVLDSKQYLEEQCKSDRLRVMENSHVKSVLGGYAQKRGDALVRRVVDALNLTNMIYYTDVYIGPQHDLKNETLIGDIDVMIIDPAHKIFYSIECKSISRSRNVKEMVEEIDKLFGSNSTMGWIAKHMRRHKWLEENRDKVFEKYGEDISAYDIRSVFVTQEDMLTPHLKKQDLPLPFLTIYDVERDGFVALESATSNFVYGQ